MLTRRSVGELCDLLVSAECQATLAVCGRSATIAELAAASLVRGATGVVTALVAFHSAKSSTDHQTASAHRAVISSGAAGG